MLKKARFLIILFFIWRTSDLIIAYVATTLQKLNVNFIYKFQTYHNDPFIPKFLLALANYDGAHYLEIARDGYRQYEQAFFPLFPVIIHFFSPLLKDRYFATGFLISNTAFLIGLYFYKNYLRAIGKKPIEIIWIFLFMLAFPTSFFFGAVYTEGLFFALISGALYFAQEKQYKMVVIFSLLTGLTRLMGTFLLIPLATSLLEQQKLKMQSKTWGNKLRELSGFILKYKRLILVSLSSLFGLFAYMLYLFFKTGDFLAFYHYQSGFNNGRSANQIILLPQVYYRYFRIFVTTSYSTTYFVAVIEFITFNLFFLVLLYDLWMLWKRTDSFARISLIGLNLFSLSNLLLPALTGTFTSIPRYALLSLSFFIRAAEIKNVFVKIGLLLIFLILHVLLLTLFVQGHFVA